MAFSVVAREDLPHNRADAVTAAVERVRSAVVGAGGGDPRWAASSTSAPDEGSPCLGGLVRPGPVQVLGQRS